MQDSQSRLGLADGSWVQLGAVLSKAGEGVIYALAGRPDLVAKIFHADLADLDVKLAKVAAMITTVPEGAVQRDGFVVLTWPQELVFRDGAAVGYLMPRIDTAEAVEIHALSNPSTRLKPLPSAPQWTSGATWAHLVTAAANLCLAVDVVHRAGAVIGDFQERNILVADTVRVTLVDCDSMQFTGPDGRNYLSLLGRAEFTAPEVASLDLRKVPRDKTSDLFALAVHIYLLIMAGNHPFMRGQWSGTGDQPDALQLARKGQWAGAPGSQLRAHPLAPPITFLPKEIQALFHRAFTRGAQDPTARPSAEEWRQALSKIEFMACDGQPQHQLPCSADVCPWCQIDSARRSRKAFTAPGTSTSSDQIAMPVRPNPSAATRQPFPAPQPYPSPTYSWPQPAHSSSGGGRWILWGALALAAVCVLAAIIVNSSGSNTTSAYTSQPTNLGAGTPRPTTSTQSTTSTWRLTTTSPVPRRATSWTAVVVGTCDEGGTCGVKQRNAPFNSAPALYPNALMDGARITVVCQTRGDTRASAGHETTNVWYRLDNGAYVNAVYLDTDAAQSPSC